LDRFSTSETSPEVASDSPPKLNLRLTNYTQSKIMLVTRDQASEVNAAFVVGLGLRLGRTVVGFFRGVV
jgi:hypothetical protein